VGGEWWIVALHNSAAMSMEEREDLCRLLELSNVHHTEMRSRLTDSKLGDGSNKWAVQFSYSAS